MLKIWFKEDGGCIPKQVKIFDGTNVKVIKHIPEWFDGIYEPEWFNNELVKRIVKGVDKSELHGLNVISPIFDSISVRDLSGGTKTLITLINYRNDRLVYVGSCGENCVQYIEEIGKERDIMIMLPYCMPFSDDIKAICLNDGSIINNSVEYNNKFFEHYIEKRDWDANRD